MPDAKTSFTKDIPAKIEADPEKFKEVGAIFLFKINGDGGGTWTVDLKDKLAVSEGDAGNAECTIELSHDNWEKISDDPAEAMQLYFAGELQVSGDAMQATKLTELLQ